MALTEGAAEAVEPEATQLALYPADQLDALPAEPGARVAELRGPGRPKGRMNRKTSDWAKFILSRYRSPLEFMAEVYSRRTIDLALEIGCKPAEALAAQVRAAEGLAPYLHGKMPVQVEVKSNLPLLVLGDPGAVLGQFLDQVDPDLLPDLSQLQPIETIEGNQGLGDEPAGQVGQAELDSDGKAQADQQLEGTGQLISDQPGETEDGGKS
ncbi:MAG TPA: hypothetical protein PKY43_12240 [Thauera aminoaromatica]|nr:hypothetical protein [Thauera aminoaromatica]